MGLFTDKRDIEGYLTKQTLDIFGEVYINLLRFLGKVVKRWLAIETSYGFMNLT